MAITAAGGLDEERARLYADLVLSRLGDAAKAALEALMLSGKYEYQSDFAKRYVAQGRAEGEAKGKAEGEAKGKAEGEAEAVLTVLHARGIPVSPEARDRIRSCRDLGELDRWIRRAVTAASVDELLGPDTLG